MAFEDIHRRYHSQIYRFILRQMESTEIAEDLTVETFVKAFRAYPRLRPEIDIEDWLIQIALNNCRNDRK